MPSSSSNVGRIRFFPLLCTNPLVVETAGGGIRGYCCCCWRCIAKDDVAEDDDDDEEEEEEGEFIKE